MYEGDAMQPQWSPHMHRISFWSLGSWGPAGVGRIAGHRDIGTIAANGEDLVMVTNDAYIDWNPVWSSDGKYLYFLSDRGGSMNLWRVSIDEQTGSTLGELQPVTTPARQMGRFRMASDARHFVFESRDFRSAVYAAQFDPIREAIVGTPRCIAEFSKAFIQPALSPDGKWIALSTTEDLGDIYLMKYDGTETRQVTIDVYRDRAPDWSPDGKEIAFYSNRSGALDIWTVHPDGSGLQRITKFSEGPWYPKWFPGRSHMVFHNATGTFLVDLSKPIEGRQAERLDRNLPPGWSFHQPSVSRDGKKLIGVLSDSVSGTERISTYDLATKHFDTLSAFGNRPVWLNDGSRILFSGLGNLRIADTRTNRSHIVSGSVDDFDQWFTISPDNRALYYVRTIREVDLWMGTFK